ncbi:MAG: glucose dehydrogenase [Nitrosarchaeum sp.]|nr:glucose dehydrogenase [Nitrosarchaeum sp.]
MMVTFAVYSIPGLSPESLLQSAFAIPESFVDSKFVGTLDLPTAMEFAPDGRLFVAEKGDGVKAYVRVILTNGTLLDQPFISVDVDSGANRGLNGITFDPNFSTNGFVYVYYTDDNPIQNGISRFTSDPAKPDEALAGSERRIFTLPNTATFHNGGALHFGGDGKLYLAVGDGGSPPNAQSLDNQLGKILRINSDGSTPSDNPFSYPNGTKKTIWALGLRNPFTFAFSPSTNKMYINDVGEKDWEEVNNGVKGANYGWPTCEGLCSPANPILTNPIYTYNHGTSGAAITGGVFYKSNVFPPGYYDSYFFGDYVKGFIKRLSPTNVVSDFLTANSPVDIDVGPDGSLYYLSINTGEVHKVQFLSSNQFPQANVVANPVSGLPSLTVNFNATDSTDPDPGTLLSYLWDFGDNTSDNTSGAVVSHIYNQLGPYVATLTVNDGDGGTDSKQIDISVGSPPTGTIITPLIGTKYNAGDTISFSGSAIDAKGDSLPDSAFKWTILFHHSAHTHPFQQFIGVKNATFAIPTLDDASSDVWYRLYLKVKDSSGLTHISTRDVVPNKSTITLASNIPGLQINLDGQPKTTPFSFVGVVGIIRELQAINLQTLDETTYQFKSWSDGGAATHKISTPASNTTYTATSVPAIIFDNSKNNNGALCSSAVCSINLSVSPDNDRMIIVAITAEGTLRPVTFVDITGGTNQGILVGKKPNTITVHFAAAPTGAGISAMSFSHIKQQPEEAENSNTILSNPTVSTGITTLTDGALIVSVVGNGQGGGTYTSHGTDQTERHDFATNSAWHGVTTEIKSLTGLDNQSHTFSKTANRQAQYVASFASADGSSATPPITTALPPGGTYSTAQSVTLSANKPATIFYTTNGSPPTDLSTTYTIPIQISTTTILKFFAKDIDGNVESIKTLTYTISSSVPSAIIFDKSNNILCSSNPCSMPVTVGSGSNRMIIVTVTDEGYLNPVTSVDITGGIGQGILVGKKQNGSGSTEQNVEMWRIMESDISDGVNTITLHFTSKPLDAGVSLLSFSGVKQQSEESEISNVVINNASIQTSITTLTDGSLIVSAVGNGQGSGTYTSHGTGQTERHDFAIPSAGHGVTTEIKAIAGLDVQSHTYSKSANRQVQYVASFAPAP